MGVAGNIAPDWRGACFEKSRAYFRSELLNRPAACVAFRCPISGSFPSVTSTGGVMGRAEGGASLNDD